MANAQVTTTVKEVILTLSPEEAHELRQLLAHVSFTFVKAGGICDALNHAGFHYDFENDNMTGEVSKKK